MVFFVIYIHGSSLIHIMFKIIDIIFTSVRDLEAAMPNIILQVKTDVKTTLREINALELSSELETLLEGQIADLIDTKHKIRYLVSKYKDGFND